jgi:hypothetical protein
MKRMLQSTRADNCSIQMLKKKKKNHQLKL